MDEWKANLQAEVLQELKVDVDRLPSLMVDKQLVVGVLEPFVQVAEIARAAQVAFYGWVQENAKVIQHIAAGVTWFQQNAVEFAKVLKQASEHLRLAIDRIGLVGALGWTFPNDDMDLNVLAAMSVFRSREEADKYMLEWYASHDPELAAVEARLLANPRLTRFTTVLPQCFRAFRTGDYAVMLPALFPILENVITQLNAPDNIHSTKVIATLKRTGKTTKKAEKFLLDVAIHQSLLTFMEPRYEQFTTVVPTIEPETGQRHAYLHGHKEPSNEKVEPIRLLQALETALSLHDRPLKLIDRVVRTPIKTVA